MNFIARFLTPRNINKLWRRRGDRIRRTPVEGRQAAMEIITHARTYIVAGFVTLNGEESIYTENGKMTGPETQALLNRIMQHLQQKVVT